MAKKTAPARPELTVNLKEQLGREVEVTGLLNGLAVEASKKQEKWIGDVTLTCQFPKVTEVPVVYRL